MTALTKTLLALAVVLLVAGLLISAGVIKVGGVAAWYVALPAGAIFLGLFLIVRMFGKETAGFDAERQAYLEKLRNTGASTAPTAPPSVPVPAVPAASSSTSTGDELSRADK